MATSVAVIWLVLIVWRITFAPLEKSSVPEQAPVVVNLNSPGTRPVEILEDGGRIFREHRLSPQFTDPRRDDGPWVVWQYRRYVPRRLLFTTAQRCLS